MITRIVRMEFKPGCVDTFVQVYQSAEKKIKSFEGCQALKLVRDENNPCVFYTISVWTDAPTLDRYRDSMLFAETWKAAKTGFSAAPLAFSLQSDIRTL